jgi:hypothetical protein
MRIQGPNGLGAAASTPTARRTTSGTFSVGNEDAATRPAPAAGLRTIGGIDALIALQGCDDPAERRRRAIKRGRLALDALDDLKLAFLAGSLDQAALGRLRMAAAELDERSGDERLDRVLAEIELRVEVELAKFESQQKPAGRTG